MHKIIVITLYFPLDALHVSDCISPSSGAFGICRYMPVPYVWLLYDYSHTTARRIDIYQMRCTAYKVAPDDGLIQSETCRASNGK